MTHFIQVLYLGRVEYDVALRLQQILVDLRKAGRIADVLLLLEHPPVITLGRNASRANILVAAGELKRRGISVHEIDRGGDVTFHGPGQLVGYPICDLRALPPLSDSETGESHRVGAVEFVRRLEETLVRVCAHYGIPAGRVPGLTGVWTLAQLDSPQKKIAAIGLHVSRGVTSHGFALNMSSDLDYFKLIVPCGISDKPVTSMALELPPGGGPLDLAQLSEVVSRQFGNVFGLQTLWLESLDPLLSATQAAPANQDTPAQPPSELQELEQELRLSCRDDISFA